MKKVLAVTLFLIVVGVAAVAIYLGSTLNQNKVTPNDTKAESPLNCELDLTQANPKADTNMGKNNDGPYPIPQYCPGLTGKVKAASAGKVILYVSDPNLLVTLDDQVYDNIDGVVKTDKTIAVNDYFIVTISLDDEAGIGWINPSGTACGDSAAWETTSIEELVNKAVSDGNTVIERQCWGDAAKGQSDFDFSNFQVIVAIEGGGDGGALTPDSEEETPSDTEIPSEDNAFITPTFLVNDSNNPVEELANVKKVCSANSTCSTDENCALGNVCADISGTKRCVADICLTNGQPNSVCQADLCTAQDPIEVNKDVIINCLAGENKEQLNYTVILTNPVGNPNNRNNLTVVDTLDENLQSDYVIRTSIPFAGLFADGAITWKNLALTPDNGRLEIKYRVEVPPGEYGKEYLNQVVVSENGVVRGSKTISTKVTVLPCTAFISDQVDAIIIGISIIVFGLLMYRLGLDKKIGGILWNFAGKGIMLNFGENSMTKPMLKQDSKAFEEKIRKRMAK